MHHVKITKKTIVCSLVIAGVIIIPLLYSVLYLGAFWDPYAKLESLPVAVVNLDQGAEMDGTHRNIGQELCDQLEDDGKLAYAFVSSKEASTGTQGNRYYATLTIPKDFSASIASADTGDKQVAAITFAANEKRNYLAAQILKSAVEQIKVSLTGKIDGEIVSQLCEKLNETPAQLNVLAIGLQSLSAGSHELAAGAGHLSSGTGLLQSNLGAFSGSMAAYTDGTGSAAAGSSDLLAGAAALEQGIDALAAGADQLDAATTDMEALRTGAVELAARTDEFNQGLQAYAQGVDTLVSNAEQTSAFLKKYVAANPGLLADPAFSQFVASLNDPANAQNLAALKQYSDTLQNASTLIAQGTEQLSSATADLPQLRRGIVALSTGLHEAQAGSQRLTQGATTMDGGLSALEDASKKLSAASKALADGASQVNQGAAAVSGGAVALQNGIDTAEDKVVSAVVDTKTKLVVLEGLDNYAETPVSVVSNPVNPVPNYGTAFAPYFLSLSLWVGALIIFFAIYLDADGKFNLLSRNTENKVLRSFAYLLIGLIQALLLGTLLKVVLGLEIQHLIHYFGACCLVSLVFISIVQFFLVFLKDIGKFLSIALLILQLTSCGGTFPMETVPRFFQVLFPFMPMTYSVGLFKEAISSGSEADMLLNLGVLGGILLVFMTLTVAFSLVRKTKVQSDAQDISVKGEEKPMILVSSSGH
jgi:putative membrane protein